MLLSCLRTIKQPKKSAQELSFTKPPPPMNHPGENIPIFAHSTSKRTCCILIVGATIGRPPTYQLPLRRNRYRDIKCYCRAANGRPYMGKDARERDTQRLLSRLLLVLFLAKQEKYILRTQNKRLHFPPLHAMIIKSTSKR